MNPKMTPGKHVIKNSFLIKHMVDRRSFLKVAGLLACWPYRIFGVSSKSSGVWVNDVHSALNPTLVEQMITVDSIDVIQKTIRQARRDGKIISVTGGRHAMGGQQFGTGTLLLDITPSRRVLNLDEEEGLVEVEAGIQWPELIERLSVIQTGQAKMWTIAQKQTGTDRLTLGGSLAANAHGRGLRMKPIVDNVESFTLVDATGEVRRCSRQENKELFRLVIGGYGLFGVVYSIQLRLVPRQKLRRVVEMAELENLPGLFNKRIQDGFLYGDFQFSCDEKSDDFIRKGILSCYQPVDERTPLSERRKELSASGWERLLYLAHIDKSTAFQKYAKHYLETNGQIYWSDLQQIGVYLDGYHKRLDEKLGASSPASEVITEIYVPRDALPRFIKNVRDDFRKNRVNLIYGTIRLIEEDDETFLAWAKQPYACVIFNLHTVHTEEGLQYSRDAFRRLIDFAIQENGSYYLTYHRHATKQQAEACYPQFAEFLWLKKKIDPGEVFQSDWYRHYRDMFWKELG